MPSAGIFDKRDGSVHSAFCFIVGATRRWSVARREGMRVWAEATAEERGRKVGFE